MTDSITHTARLLFGYRVTFAWDGSLRVEWEPDVPVIRSARHRRKFFKAYSLARREFMRDEATTIGGNVGIADMTGEFEVVTPATKH